MSYLSFAPKRGRNVARSASVSAPSLDARHEASVRVKVRLSLPRGGFQYDVAVRTRHVDDEVDSGSDFRGEVVAQRNQTRLRPDFLERLQHPGKSGGRLQRVFPHSMLLTTAEN